MRIELSIALAVSKDRWVESSAPVGDTRHWRGMSRIFTVGLGIQVQIQSTVQRAEACQVFVANS